MNERIYFCIQSQKGCYIFVREYNSIKGKLKGQKLIYLDEEQRGVWIERLKPKENFIADQISFLMKEILKQNPISFIALEFKNIPRCDNFFFEIFNHDNGSLICNFYYYRPIKNFLKKYDMYNRFGESLILLPSHIQELELQELFLINEGRIAVFIGR